MARAARLGHTLDGFELSLLTEDDVLETEEDANVINVAVIKDEPNVAPVGYFLATALLQCAGQVLVLLSVAYSKLRAGVVRLCTFFAGKSVSNFLKFKSTRIAMSIVSSQTGIEQERLVINNDGSWVHKDLARTIALYCCNPSVTLSLKAAALL